MQTDSLALVPSKQESYKLNSETPSISTSLFQRAVANISLQISKKSFKEVWIIGSRVFFFYFYGLSV
jgi:hypothetical protein